MLRGPIVDYQNSPGNRKLPPYLLLDLQRLILSPLHLCSSRRRQLDRNRLRQERRRISRGYGGLAQ